MRLFRFPPLYVGVCAFTFLTGICLFATAAPLTVDRLRTENRVQPLGLDERAPRLSWNVHALANERGDGQSAYRVLASASPEGLATGNGELWDSGKVRGASSIQVPWRGAALRPGQRVHWKVKVWNRADGASAWSEPSWFEVGLLDAKDWKAVWIDNATAQPLTVQERWKLRPAPLFRKTFTLAKPVSKARLYAAGLGYLEASCNGVRVGDHVLDPGWTAYAKRVLYATHDVTPLLKQGPNTLGAFVGNGWWNLQPQDFFNHFHFDQTLAHGEPRVIMQLEVQYTDGTRETIGTDASWKVGASGLLRNDVYLGEYFDARKHPEGWDKPGFDDRAWPAAKLATTAVGPLQAQAQPPIRVTRTVKPVAITEPKPGLFVVDMGQNFAGWVTLKAKGAAGTRISLRYAELLYPDGTPNGTTSTSTMIKQWKQELDVVGYRPEDEKAPKTAWQMDVVLLKGTGAVETYTPRFTWHGFRYVAIEGYPGKPTLEAIEGLRLNSDVTPAGRFDSGNELFNRIHNVTQWTLLSNIFSVESDCPHRERLGYGGDIITASEMAMLNYDMSQFYAKSARDLEDGQFANGALPTTAPYVGIGGDGERGVSAIGWGSAHPVVVWHLYQYYGDRRLIEEQYDVAKRWVDFIKKVADRHGGVIDHDISDHESLTNKPAAFTGTAFYYWSATLLSRMAGVLGKAGDQRKYEVVANSVKRTIQQTLTDKATGLPGAGDQTSLTYALYMDLVPPKRRQAVVDALVDDVVVQRNGHLSTGIFGTKYLLSVLSDNGRADIANLVATRKTYPGWGYMLSQGATTLWEAWRLDELVGSHNHPMFGSISEWFWKSVAGIAPAPDAVGFDKIVIHPRWLDGTPWAKGEYESARGLIRTHFRVERGETQLDVLIPVGATATVFVPTSDPKAVTESGVAIARAKGVKFVRAEKDVAVFSVPSGDYHFKAPAPPAPAPVESPLALKEGSPLQSLPSHIEQLTTFGERASISPDNKRVAFMGKSFGDAFEIDLATRQIRCLTCDIPGAAFLRVMHLWSGDYLLIGPPHIYIDDLGRGRGEENQLWFLSSKPGSRPVRLGVKLFEGAAVSKTTMKLAWSESGVQNKALGKDNYRLFTGELQIDSTAATAKIVNQKVVYQSVHPPCKLEAQDFFDGDNKLTFSCYKTSAQGKESAVVMVADLVKGKVKEASYDPTVHNEPEGILPAVSDGEKGFPWTLVESDRHSIDRNLFAGINGWPIDIYKLQLDGDGQVWKRLTFFSEWKNWHASNPVASTDGRFMAFQIGGVGDAGVFTGSGKGILLYWFKK
ncbi:MAG: family 78 glycoside hydrolase catalytic domain [Deltaproteobacteria bacterium]|nr:family 78 glycoside hydrolase catalytic domain [Deltaproteobacteria bacterium]